MNEKVETNVIIVGADNSFAVLLRPDNHIGFIFERASADELKSDPFMREFFDAD